MQFAQNENLANEKWIIYIIIGKNSIILMLMFAIYLNEHFLNYTMFYVFFFIVIVLNNNSYYERIDNNNKNNTIFFWVDIYYAQNEILNSHETLYNKK